MNSPFRPRRERRVAARCLAAALTGSLALGLPAMASAAVAPASTSPPVVSGASTQGSRLTTTNGTWSNAPTSYSYNWLRCSTTGSSCSRISGATATTYTLIAADAGHTIRSAVHAKNAAGTTTKRSAATGIVTSTGTAPASTGKPVVSGTAQTGQTLNTSNGSWSGTTPMTYAYAWQRCDTSGAACAGVSGATGSSYTVTSADEGHTLRAQVTAKNSAGSASATSAQTGSVPSATPTTTPSPSPTPPPTSTPSVGAGLHVSGNQLLDAGGTAVQLHGVNYPGTEYACIQGWGIFDGPSDDAMVTALRSWNNNVVHLGLNEDCVLGINGVKAAYAGANYLNAVKAFVGLLHAHGMAAELSLMWAAPGTQQALDHPAILDADHAPAALKAIANAFKDDPQTLIGLQSEPHDISWACWKNGGASCSVGYTALGMQGALDAVRSTGATNVVTASGINYSNDLTGWLANEPSDPQGQLMAEAHVYGLNSCDAAACLNTQMAPVAAQVPLVFGETGEAYDASDCGSSKIAGIMNWADAHGVGYEAWQWNTWGNCLDLIADFNGTPATNAYAQWVHTHYATLP